MSKFKDELRRVSQVEPQPMGFRTAQTAPPKPRILLVATLAEGDIDHLAERVAGADAGLLPVPDFSSGAKALQKATQDPDYVQFCKKVSYFPVYKDTKTLQGDIKSFDEKVGPKLAAFYKK